MNTPEHETAAEVAEFLGYTYVPGIGVYAPDGRALYIEDATYLMSEEEEEKNQRYREQYGGRIDLTREGNRAFSKIMWREADTKIMRFTFWGNRKVLDLHLPQSGLDRNFALWEWKEARRSLEKSRAIT